LKLTPITPNDIVIDVASEYSVFPDVVRQLFGARVFQQDLIYRSGIEGDHIGGSAKQMDIDFHFTSKLILHNAATTTTSRPTRRRDRVVGSQEREAEDIIPPQQRK